MGGKYNFHPLLKHSLALFCQCNPVVPRKQSLNVCRNFAERRHIVFYVPILVRRLMSTANISGYLKLRHIPYSPGNNRLHSHTHQNVFTSFRLIEAQLWFPSANYAIKKDFSRVTNLRAHITIKKKAARGCLKNEQISPLGLFWRLHVTSV